MISKAGCFFQPDFLRILPVVLQDHMAEFTGQGGAQQDRGQGSIIKDNIIVSVYTGERILVSTLDSWRRI